MTRAARNRTIAIGMINELYLPSPGTPANPADPDNPESWPMYLFNYCDCMLATPSEVAANIDKLAQLGRTVRWRTAIYNWAAIVRESTDREKLRWAFLRGMLWAGGAVE
jgi:hypothetical protein